MGRVIQGKLSAENRKFAIVVSRFNSFICDRLVEGALDCLYRHGAVEEDVDIVKVPGAFELAQTAQRLARKDYDGVIVLGAVIRGSTPHFDYVSAEVSKGVAQVAMNSDKAVSFGVLTCDTIEQAIERAGTKAGNNGTNAALTVIEMVNLFAELD